MDFILRAHRWGWGIAVCSSRPGRRQTKVLSAVTEEISKLLLHSSIFYMEQGSRHSHQFTGSEILMCLVTAAALLGASCGIELFLLCLGDLENAPFPWAGQPLTLLMQILLFSGWLAITHFCLKRSLNSTRSLNNCRPQPFRWGKLPWVHKHELIPFHRVISTKIILLKYCLI